VEVKSGILFQAEWRNRAVVLSLLDGVQSLQRFAAIGFGKKRAISKRPWTYLRSPRNPCQYSAGLQQPCNGCAVGRNVRKGAGMPSRLKAHVVVKVAAAIDIPVKLGMSGKFQLCVHGRTDGGARVIGTRRDKYIGEQTAIEQSPIPVAI